MVIVIREGYTSVAPLTREKKLDEWIILWHGLQHQSGTYHAMTIVNTKALSKATAVAIGTVKNLFVRRVIIQVANATKILGERLSPRFTICIEASILCWLKSLAFHAHHFRHGITIEWLVFILQW